MMQRILVIDDDAMLRTCVVRYLEAFGHSTITAEDGLNGERIAQSESPDLILLDMRMPGRSGLSTLTALRASAATSEIPVIMLSGCDDDLDAARRAGAVQVLLKPFSSRELEDAVARAIAAAGAPCTPLRP